MEDLPEGYGMLFDTISYTTILFISDLHLSHVIRDYVSAEDERILLMFFFRVLGATNGKSISKWILVVVSGNDRRALLYESSTGTLILKSLTTEN